MKNLYLILFLSLVNATYYSQIKLNENMATKEDIPTSAGYIDKSPSCIINQGQWDSHILALARTKGLYTRFYNHGFDLNYFKTEYENFNAFDRSFPPKLTYQQKGHVIRLEQVNGNFSNNNLVIHQKKSWKLNYLKSGGMIKDVPAATDYTYKNVYPGIDMHWYFDNTYTYFEYIISAGADASMIQLQVNGADEIFVNNNNEVVLLTTLGELKFKGLKAYQQIDEQKIEIPVQWVLHKHENSTYLAFDMGEYNPNYPLVIDPYAWGAVIGGSGQMEQIRGVKAREFADEIYATGFTVDADFPVTPGAYQTTSDNSATNYDGVVCYFDPVNDLLLSCTYIVGSQNDFCMSIDIDQPTQRVFVLGGSNSSDIQVTTNAPQNSNQGGYDCFLLELTPLLNNLVFSTYWGGNNDDGATDLKYKNNKLFFTGFTTSNNFPVTVNNVQNTLNGTLEDGFVVCIDLSLHQAVLSTYLGGNSPDFLWGIDVRNNNEIVVCGKTSSPDFPMSTAFYDNTYNGGDDGIIAILNPSGSSLNFSTFFGGSNYDVVNDIRFKNDTIFYGGVTHSVDFPLYNPLGFYNGSYDGFVAAIHIPSSSLLFSTYLGGSGNDYITAVDICGLHEFVLGGYSSSSYYIYFGNITGNYVPTTIYGFIQKLDINFGLLNADILIDSSNVEVIYDIDATWHSYISYGGYTTSPGVKMIYLQVNGSFIQETNFNSSNQGGGSHDGLVGYIYGCLHNGFIATPQASFTSITCDQPVVNINLSYFQGIEIAYWSNFIDYGPVVNGIDSCQTLRYIANTFNNCTSVGYFLISCDTAKPNINAYTSQDLNCYNNLTGTAIIGVSGLPSSQDPFQYLWENGVNTNPANVSDTGYFSVIVTNVDNGCFTIDSTYIGVDTISPHVSIISLDFSTELNCNYPNLDLLAIPDTNFIAYQWSNGDNDSITTVLFADTFTVTVTNLGNGCTGTASINITSDFAIPTPSIHTANNQFELNCTNPTLSVEAEGGKFYTWSGNLPADSIVNISSPGIYTVTVSGDNGCTSTTNVIITSNFTPPPAFIISLDNNYTLSCKNPEITLLAQQGVNYSWQPNVSNTYIAYVNQAGNYVVTVTGANGCTATAQVSITDNTGTVELEWVDTIRPTCYANDGKLTVGVSQGTSPYQYSWNTNPNNVNSLSNIPPGYYYVIVTDAAGCKDTLQIDFTCKLNNNTNDTNSTTITITNLITPNDDGINDSWVVPELDQYPNNKVRILNRWGDEIFHAQPYQNNWSGQSNTGMVVGGNKVTSGVYFYVIDLGNGTLPIKGYLVLEY